jgi:hypothetical protein
MPTTALEKIISLFIEIIIMAFLIVLMQLLSLILDGIVCSIYNYNEWKDILPAIKDFFTPELSIVNGMVSFGYGRYMILEESWLSNKWFIWGVSLNKYLYTSIFVFLFCFALILTKNRVRTNIRIFSMTKGLKILNIIFFSSLIIGLLIFAGNHEDFFGMIFGFGPWCYNYEYGWIIQTFVLLLWISHWLFFMYRAIKDGEAK